MTVQAAVCVLLYSIAVFDTHTLAANELNGS